MEKRSQQSAIKVGMVQKPPVFLNTARSVALACRLIHEAAAAEADLLVFPETWLAGYPVWLDFAESAAIWDHPPAKALFRILFEQAVTLGDSATQALAKAVRESGIHLVIGVHERGKNTLYNTILYLAPDQEIAVHRKLMPTYSERLIWGRGDGSTLHVMETPFGRVGGLVCWEHWMPFARAAMHAQNELIHVAQWPMVKEMNQVASRHYAFEGNCFTVASGCVLTHDQVLSGAKSLAHLDSGAVALLRGMMPDANGYFLRGGSGLIAPNGDYLVGPVYDDEQLIFAEIEPHLATESKLFLDTDGHYARPDIFQLHVDTKPHRQVVFGADGDPEKKAGTWPALLAFFVVVSDRHRVLF